MPAEQSWSLDADQLDLLDKAWKCMSSTDHSHGVVAVNIDRDLGERFLDIRETPADVRLTVQLDEAGTDTGQSLLVIALTFWASFLVNADWRETYLSKDRLTVFFMKKVS